MSPVTRDAQDKASEDYPAIELPTGQRLHVYCEDGEWCVWLNTEVTDFDGICVAVGPTRDAAIREAVAVFEAATEALQAPPPAEKEE